MVSYNFMGIRVQNASAMLQQLSREMGWHVILGQEITKAVEFPETVDDHQVFADQPSGGGQEYRHRCWC